MQTNAGTATIHPINIFVIHPGWHRLYVPKPMTHMWQMWRKRSILVKFWKLIWYWRKKTALLGWRWVNLQSTEVEQEDTWENDRRRGQITLMQQIQKSRSFKKIDDTVFFYNFNGVSSIRMLKLTECVSFLSKIQKTKVSWICIEEGGSWWSQLANQNGNLERMRNDLWRFPSRPACI